MMPYEWKPGPIDVDGRGNVTLTPHEGEPFRLQRRDLPSLIKQLVAEEERYRSMSGDGAPGGPYRTPPDPMTAIHPDDAEEVTPIIPYEPAMQFFVPLELSKELRMVWRKIADLASTVILSVGRNSWRTIALQKLLEVQDAIEHARRYKPG